MEFLLTSESERGRSPSSRDKVELLSEVDENLRDRRTIDRVLLFLALAFQPSIV